MIQGALSMNTTAALIMAMMGLAAGWFVPITAEKLIAYKFLKKKKEVPDGKKYLSVISRLICMLISGILLAFTGLLTNSVFNAVLYSIVMINAVLISVIDIRVRMIPNETVFLLAAVGLVLLITAGDVMGIIQAVISVVVVMSVFIALGSALGLDSIGAGDVKLAGAMALVLGFPQIMYGLIGMSGMLVIWIGIGLLLKKLTLKSPLAFGPFMMGGTVLAVYIKLLGL
jgi:leader peptidase (prepilin peptidase)/N-methyltransferase